MKPNAANVLGWLPAVAVTLPALPWFAELNQPRKMPEWAPTAFLVAVAVPIGVHINRVIGPMRLGEYLRLHGAPSLQALAIRPEHFDLRVLLPFIGAAVLIASAAGRLRRPAGPSLAGATAVVSVVTAVFAIRLLPVALFPRMLAGLLAVLASFAAEEREIPSSPWMRLGLTTGAALCAVAIVTQQAGFDLTASIATGTAAALALSAGLLAHEITWQKPSLSFALRLAILVALQPVFWSLVTGHGVVSAARVSPVPGPIEIALLAGTFVALAIAHTRRRGSA